MIDLNLNPSRKELRQFSVALIVATAVVGGLLWGKLGANPWSYALWIGGPVAGLIGLALPIAIKPVFIALSVVAFPIGMVVGTLAMAVVYYLVITPLGVVFRLSGRDPLYRRFDRSAATYWIARKSRPGAAKYFQQF